MNDDALRKAAILIAGLDADSAAALLKELPLDQATQIRECLPRLGPVAAEERDRAINDFFQEALLADPFAAAEIAGVEIEESLARKIEAGVEPSEDTGLEPQTPAEPAIAASPSPAPSRPASADSPFAFLRTASVAELAEFLAPQPAEIIATALARLATERAAEAVRLLPPRLQGEVLSLLASGVTSDGETQSALERRLAAAITRRQQAPPRPAGLAAVEAILDSVDGAARSAMLTALASQDRGLLHRLGYPLTPTVDAAADELHEPAVSLAMPRWATLDHPLNSNSQSTASEALPSPSRLPSPAEFPQVDSARSRSAETDTPARKPSASGLSFQDLLELDDGALVKVFGAADPQVALLALAGASRELVERMLRRLPAKQAKALSRRLEQMGPLRLSDLEAAQRHLAGLATQLAAHGAIPFPSKRRLSMAA